LPGALNTQVASSHNHFTIPADAAILEQVKAQLND
jgi:hypothetical protein